MLMLDLFAGMKGASAAMKERGWTVITVDNNPSLNPDIVADISQYHYEGPTPDLIWASPPCTEFTKLTFPWLRESARPDTSLAMETKRIITETNPRYWVVENVRGSVPYFSPIFGRLQKKSGNRYLWGNFPIFDCTPLYGKRHGWKSAAQRAKIPYSLSLSLCLSVERSILSAAVAENGEARE